MTRPFSSNLIEPDYKCPEIGNLNVPSTIRSISDMKKVNKSRSIHLKLQEHMIKKNIPETKSRNIDPAGPVSGGIRSLD